MNKREVNDMLGVAYSAIEKAKLLEADGKILKAYRGQIAAFGAAITTGSLPAAVAFFMDKGGSEVDRPKLMQAIQLILQEKNIMKNSEKLFDYVKDNDSAKKEQVINAAIALKLAMNLYPQKEK